jgi:hypothetical protein
MRSFTSLRPRAGRADVDVVAGGEVVIENFALGGSQDFSSPAAEPA